MSEIASIERDGGRLVLARYLEPLTPYLADKTLTARQQADSNAAVLL